MTMGDGCDQPESSLTAPPQSRHFGVDPSFIDKHDFTNLFRAGAKPRLTPRPDRPGGLYIRTRPFAGVCGFFKGDPPGTQPVINRRLWGTDPVDFAKAVGKLPQCYVRRLFKPAEKIRSIGIRRRRRGGWDVTATLPVSSNRLANRTAELQLTAKCAAARRRDMTAETLLTKRIHKSSE
jgi:hypothetical protein